MPQSGHAVEVLFRYQSHMLRLNPTIANHPPRDLAEGTITSRDSNVATSPKRLFPIFLFED
jgi:hypothetical protein